MQAFCANKIKGIASHTDECIKESMCKVSNAESNSTENIPEDGLHQVDPNYVHFSCITQDCKKCGPEVVLTYIFRIKPRNS